MIHKIIKNAKLCARYVLESGLAIKKNWCALKRAFFRKNNVLVYVQTPLHRNVGDLAIAEATIDYLQKNFPDTKIIEFVYAEMRFVNRLMLRLSIRKGDVIIVHGGGNLGTWYPNEEYYRQSVIRMFPKNSILIMPQSVFFGNASEDALIQFRSVYAGHPDLQLCVRDGTSYTLAKKKIGCRCVLTPDIVLGFTSGLAKKEYARDQGILLCLRNDREKRIDADFEEKIFKYCTQELKEKVTVQDTHINIKVTRENRRKIVMDMLQLYHRANLVITDRFHGGVFSYITGTPCIVIESADHKVRGGYVWLKRAENILLLNDLDQIRQEIPKLLGKLSTPFLYESEFDGIKAFITKSLERQE